MKWLHLLLAVLNLRILPPVSVNYLFTSSHFTLKNRNNNLLHFATSYLKIKRLKLSYWFKVLSCREKWMTSHEQIHSSCRCSPPSAHPVTVHFLPLSHVCLTYCRSCASVFDKTAIKKYYYAEQSMRVPRKRIKQ